MKKLFLVSPLPPSVNNYLNYRVITKGRKKIVHAYPSEETVAYKDFFIDYVKDEIKKQKWKQPKKDKLVFVSMVFYLDRKRKDPNNFLKVLFDALTESGVYRDDDIALPIVKRVYIDSLNPRIEIEIYESEAIGIFENKDELNKFVEDNCIKCKKNFNKCSIFKKLLENRIIEEVKDGKCLARRG